VWPVGPFVGARLASIAARSEAIFCSRRRRDISVSASRCIPPA